MLHFIRVCLFRAGSPLHNKFSSSLEKFIAERIASRVGKWFPCIFRDLHSSSEKLAEVLTKVIELEQCIEALQPAPLRPLITELTLCSLRLRMHHEQQ